MGQKYQVYFNDETFVSSAEKIGERVLRVIGDNKAGDNKSWELDVVKIGPSHYSVIHENQSYDIRFSHHADDEVWAFWSGQQVRFTLLDSRKARKKTAGSGTLGTSNIAGPIEIRAMMPGKISALSVKLGDEVKAGQGVVVLEAMKMENELVAPKDGRVTKIFVKEGDSVENGSVLVIVE